MGREQRETEAPSDERFDHHTASLWLRHLKEIYDVREVSWPRQVVQAYSHWTASANGAGLDARERIDHILSEWNRGYFNVLAHCLGDPELKETIEALTEVTITSLPDTSFLDVVEAFLRSVDDVFFHSRLLSEPVAVNIRAILASRLQETLAWKLLVGQESTSIGMDIGPAVAVVFFNELSWTQPANCYVLSKGIDRLDPFLPRLEELVRDCPSIFLATVLLNLLEVSPRRAHIGILNVASETWMEKFPNSTRFWVDQNIGYRVCRLIERIWSQEMDGDDTDGNRGDWVNELLSMLVSMGVSEAVRLERKLANRQGGGR